MNASHRLNSVPEAEAHDLLLSCCGSRAWVHAMLERRPFTSDLDLLNSAATTWTQLATADHLQAFEAHPRIGDLETLKQRYQSGPTPPSHSAEERSASQSAVEQAAVERATEATLEELATLNERYFERFGFIFIVCATGKSADEMLEILRQRVANSRAEELANAAREQLEITVLRLRKLAA